VAGIRLIRLAQIRPAGLLRWVGRRSENAAHRFAIEWDEDGTVRSGVFIPRRDTDSALNVALGGRLFPGHHHRADFAVDEQAAHLAVAFTARDGSQSVATELELTDALTPSTLFDDRDRFPAGSIEFDSALVMRNIPVRWQPREPLGTATTHRLAEPVPTSG